MKILRETPKKKKTFVTFVLDDSGSMSSVRKQTVDGFNDQLGAIQGMQSEDHDVYLTLITFSDPNKIRTVRLRQPVKEVLPLNLVEYRADGGSTALLDGMKEGIYATDNRELDDTENNAALIVFMTDGGENSSKQTTKEQIKELIQSRTARGNWTFTYMGVGSIEEISGGYGIRAGNITQFQVGAKGMVENYAAHSHGLTAYASARNLGATATMDFYSGTPSLDKQVTEALKKKEETTK
jgi:hypothetical protein